MAKEIQQSLISYRAQIEAILYACADPIEISKLAEILEISISACRQQVDELLEINEDDERGLMIVILDDKLQLVTKEKFSDSIEKAIAQKKNMPLTSTAMEVLSIIAYNQPVTKGFVEQVRGVNSNSVVNTLIDKGLIEEAGRMDLPGRPISYKTSDIFLRSFGISSLQQLPPIDNLEDQMDISENIEENSKLEDGEELQ